MRLAIAAVDPVTDFVEWMEAYQSNHYGDFDKARFKHAYDKLPDAMKAAIKYGDRGRLYRGDEFFRDDLYPEYRKGRVYPALSFTPNHGFAEHFGYVLPLAKAVDSFDTSIDTRKLVRYLNKQKIEHDIGDDEGEVVLINVKLK